MRSEAAGIEEGTVWVDLVISRSASFQAPDSGLLHELRESDESGVETDPAEGMPNQSRVRLIRHAE